MAGHHDGHPAYPDQYLNAGREPRFVDLVAFFRFDGICPRIINQVRNVGDLFRALCRHPAMISSTSTGKQPEECPDLLLKPA